LSRKAHVTLARPEPITVRPPVADPVIAALERAHRPLSNDELAAAMGVTKSEASKRVAALAGMVRKERDGRRVAISLH
ncbi:MAG TPA: helix-turn-helix domain-containing protein, partial [Hyphomicrobiaceae bacterium]|nr:helix-turn-helix domain-containing protein [Hyphomicrobiaceae bacterium]